jgi:molecular chaperone Hsp33
MNPPDDLVRPFRVGPYALRGRQVRLGSVLDRIVRRHAYPEPVGEMLGQAMALAALLAATLKYDGIFTLQTRSDGPIRLLMADVTTDGAVRAYAQYDAAAVAAATGGKGAPVPRLIGAGHLAFTVDQGEHTERYQGIVALEGGTLAECVHHYFRQSEQIEAGLTVAAASLPGLGWRAGGLLLQRTPEEGGEAEGWDPDAVGDAWRQALAKLGTSSERELTSADLGADDLLYRLFHEDGVRVFPTQSLADRCRCSRARIETVFRSLSDAEIADLVVDGQAVATCEFCSSRYVFSTADLVALQRGTGAAAS